jgi:GTP 3',8-cyclase
MSPAAPDDNTWPIRTYALEIHAVQHCNLHCVGCAQSSPHQTPGEDDVRILEAALRNLGTLLSCTKLQVVGGEPLLHASLPELLRVAAGSGVGRKLVVKTNGLLLHRASSELWRLADEVIVSVYPATESILRRRKEALMSRASEFGTRLEFRHFAQFSEIVIDQPRDDHSVTSGIYDTCEYKLYTHSLREGRLYRCAPSVNVARQRIDWDAEDSLDALDATALQGRLRGFLNSPRPLLSCASCVGSSGASFPHRMAPTSDRTVGR